MMSDIDQRDERIEALSAHARAADKRAMAAERELDMLRGNMKIIESRVAELVSQLRDEHYFSATLVDPNAEHRTDQPANGQGGT